MPSITTGVDFGHIAREWRCKWAPEDDKICLQNVQKCFEQFLPELKATPNLISVQRVVCGGCHDFKVIMKMKADHFDTWADAKWNPEDKFLTALKAIPGVEAVETQTYTMEDM